MTGPGGVYWDRTYAPVVPPDWAIRIMIEDPELFTLLTYLRQAMAAGQLDAVAAAQGYFRNVDLLVPAVLKDWPFLDQLSDEIVSMLPLLVAFIAVEVAGRFLMLVGRGPWVFIGAALVGMAKAAGWSLQVTFYGSVAVHVLEAGRELLLVRRRPDGTLDQLAQKHLKQAVVLVRRAVVLIATILAAKAAAKDAPPAARAAAVAGRQLVRQVRLTIRPELAPALAGAYGTGPSLENVAMSARAPEKPGGSPGTGSGRTAARTTPKCVLDPGILPQYSSKQSFMDAVRVRLLAQREAGKPSLLDFPLAEDGRWRTVSFLAKSGRQMRGRYALANPDAPILQAGHMQSEVYAKAAGKREYFMLEDADLNWLTGQTVEARKNIASKPAVLIDGYPVDIPTARAFEGMGWLPSGTVDAAPVITPPGL